MSGLCFVDYSRNSSWYRSLRCFDGGLISGNFGYGAYAIEERVTVIYFDYVLLNLGQLEICYLEGVLLVAEGRLVVEELVQVVLMLSVVWIGCCCLSWHVEHWMVSLSDSFTTFDRVRLALMLAITSRTTANEHATVPSSAPVIGADRCRGIWGVMRPHTALPSLLLTSGPWGEMVFAAVCSCHSHDPELAWSHSPRGVSEIQSARCLSP